MKDIRLEKMADVLVNYSLNLKKGDLFLIRGYYLTMPLITELYTATLKLGANPIVRINPDGLNEIYYREANDDQINFLNPITYFEYETINAVLDIMGEYNTRNLSGVDPEIIKKRNIACKKLIELMHKRFNNNDLLWCGTQYPTHADAQEANMSLEDYEAFVFNACLLNYENPAEEWKKISSEQERIVNILSTKSEFIVRSKGTELYIHTDKRKWINCDGRKNFPDGEVYTSPVENKVDGHIQFSFPGIENGREIEDIHLSFEKGKVKKASAKKGEDLLLSLIDTDEGARRVGEFAIGTNYGIQKFTKNMLFDEKIGGTIHLALGEGFAESGSKNKSLIHWDMLCDMRQGGEIIADGEIIYKDGKLVI